VSTLTVPYPVRTRQHVGSWAFSLLFHGVIVAWAFAFVSDLRLAPQPEPFRWEVAVVDVPVPQRDRTPEPAQPAPAKPAPIEQEPVHTKPLTHVVESVQQVQQVIRQEVRETVSDVRPIPQTMTVQQTPLVSQVAQAVTPSETNPLVQEAVEETPASAETTPVIRETAAVTQQPVMEPMAASAVAEMAVVARPAVTATPVKAIPPTKPDYGWLAEALWTRVEQLKRYPHLARMNRWEGRVVLRVVIKDDGQLLDLAVEESSGHTMLDNDAIEVLKKASPLTLKHPLGKPQVVVQVPISYQLQ